jgi:hypothetical protein
MQRSDEVELSSHEGLTGDDDTTTETADSTRQSGVSARLGGLFSVRTFLVALLCSVVAVVAGGAIPLVGFLGRLGGLVAVGFAVGLLASKRHYAEVALAGALASGLGFVASTLTSAFFPFAVSLLSEYGVAIAGVGAGVGALAALVGHYFGRDLRDGFTREI